MGSSLVEVGDIGIEHALELLLLKDQQVVQAFLSHTSQEALADRIGSRSVIGRLEKLDATGRRHSEETGSKLAVVITNQVLRHLPIRSRFPQLLRHPGIGRRSCDAHVDHLARLQLDKEERKKRSKEQVGDLEEITGPDLCGVGVHKGRPLLAPWLLGANSSHVLLDGALADAKAQFQQFSPNPFGAPEPIVLRHLSDQGDRFGGLRLVSMSL